LILKDRDVVFTPLRTLIQRTTAERNETVTAENPKLLKEVEMSIQLDVYMSSYKPIANLLPRALKLLTHLITKLVVA
jgi:hypothetical protein